MNKRNIIKLCDYKKNKNKVEHEHHCFKFLDSLKDRVEMTETYAKNFKQHLVCMVKDGNVNQSFANNLNQQVDLIIMTASASVARSKVK